MFCMKHQTDDCCGDVIHASILDASHQVMYEILFIETLLLVHIASGHENVTQVASQNCKEFEIVFVK